MQTTDQKTIDILGLLLRILRRDRDVKPAGADGFFLFRLVTPLDFIINIMLGAASGIGLIIAINFGAGATADTRSTLMAAALFLVFLYVFRFTQITLLEICAAAVESHLQDTRNGIVEKISSLEFFMFEKIPKNDLFSGITKHYDVVNNGVVPLTSAIRSIPLVVLLFIYLGFISIAATLILLFMCIICTGFYLSRLARIRADLSQLYLSENRLLGEIDDLLRGFAELKFSQQKMQELTKKVGESINQSASSRLSSTRVMVDMISFTNMVNYLFAGCIVFVLPTILGHGLADLDKIVALSLFLIGPVGSLIEGIQQYELVRFSYQSIMDFKNKIDSFCDKNYERNKCPSSKKLEGNFVEVKAEQISYIRKNLRDGSDFIVGPVNLSITPGKLILIEGGNGSGKTTLIRLLTGLYEPSSGDLYCDSIVIAPPQKAQYRELFGVIMADFHVFRRLYGMKEAERTVFNNYLKDLGLEKCCIESIRDEIPVDLSTGQRKRLALAIALTENRPVLVFDEWAADQDPYFRKKFYYEILPALKSAGKALIIVSHDDRYFDIADERYHMEDGRMKLVRRRKPRVPPPGTTKAGK